jgi:CRISPR/Cas system CMR-associated protein Cmr5 small subunit
MNVKGTAQSEYASLSGKIHSLVIDKSLTISGACADSKATGEAIEKAMDSVKEESAEYAIEKALESVSDLAEETARKAAVDSVNTLVAEAVNEFAVMTAEEVAAICV